MGVGEGASAVSARTHRNASAFPDASPDREASIVITPGLHARGDERLLKTAIAELLHNAWAYASADRAVRIEVDAQQDLNGTTLRIRDHGDGFDPAQAARMGEPFQRLAPDAHPEGAGLGLAIARRIAERHGGTLRLEGRIGEGATALLFLPSTLPSTLPRAATTR